MNKRDLVTEVANRTGREPQDVAQVVDAVTDVIVLSVASGEKVVLQGFGTFVRQHRARRVARDINAGTKVVVPATNVPAFRPGKPFRDAVLKRRRRRPAANTRRTPRRLDKVAPTTG